MAIDIVVAGLVLVAAVPSGQGLADYSYADHPTSLARVIRSRGAEKVVRELFEADVPWAGVMKRVGSGEPAWLDVAISLKPGADAHAGEELRSAVGASLVPNAAYVLGRLVPSFELTAICGGPSVDDVQSYDEAIRRVQKTEAAVRRIGAPGLRDRRDQCLQALEASRDGLKRFFEVQ